MISETDLMAFYAKLKTKPANLRLGQFFCNKFNITDAELFYCKDENRVWDIIYQKYLQ